MGIPGGYPSLGAHGPVGNLPVMDTELRRLREILKAMLEERDLSDDVFELVSDARESLGKALSLVEKEQR